ncbi:hypothetical protein [Oceanisphaera sp. KMM 10153]|uniref:hypothetical protein n=1 Tax=Oceanisphaera submarina TaxID=3390193 RepID=UPI003975F121
MAIRSKKEHLQESEYVYTWRRDQGDGTYAGKLDKIKVDKDEGYEVLYFIQTLMNKHQMTKLKDVHNIEDALHSPSLSSVVMRDDLIKKIEQKLSLTTS